MSATSTVITITDHSPSSTGRRGDDVAASSLLELRIGAVRRATRRLNGDQQTAEEIVEDVIGRLWERAVLRGESFNAAYVHRCVDNELVSRWRASERRTAKLTLLAAGATSPSIEERATDRIDLAQHLSQLSDAQRAVVALRHLSGLSYAEIAQQLDMPNGTVCSTLARALGRLRQLYA